MTVGSMRGKLPDPPISVLERQDIKYDSPNFAVRVVSTESASCFDGAVNLKDWWTRRWQTARAICKVEGKGRCEVSEGEEDRA